MNALPRAEVENSRDVTNHADLKSIKKVHPLNQLKNNYKKFSMISS